MNGQILQPANNITDPDQIEVGQKLTIPNYKMM